MRDVCTKEKLRRALKDLLRMIEKIYKVLGVFSEIGRVVINE
jgi:hypothetical protein